MCILNSFHGKVDSCPLAKQKQLHATQDFEVSQVFEVVT